MSYIESITEELQFKANWSHGSQNHSLLRKLYEYIAHLRAYAMFQFRDHRPGVPDTTRERMIAYPIHHISSVRLEINGEAVEAASYDEIDRIISFAAGLENAEQVKWNAKYSYFHDDLELETKEGYKPAYIYFEEMSSSRSGTSDLLGPKTIIQVRDEDRGGERFSYYYSPLGKNDLFYGTQTSEDINDVSNVPVWHGDFESMGVVLPITTDTEKQQSIKKAFRELCDHYGAVELSDCVVEHSNRIIYEGSGVSVFLSVVCSSNTAGALPQTPGFFALISRERLLPPQKVYHTSCYDNINRRFVTLFRLLRHVSSALRQNRPAICRHHKLAVTHHFSIGWDRVFLL